jgi:hypothetical protein
MLELRDARRHRETVAIRSILLRSAENVLRQRIHSNHEEILVLPEVQAIVASQQINDL